MGAGPDDKDARGSKGSLHFPPPAIRRLLEIETSHASQEFRNWCPPRLRCFQLNSREWRCEVENCGKSGAIVKIPPVDEVEMSLFSV